MFGCRQNPFAIVDHLVAVDAPNTMNDSNPYTPPKARVLDSDVIDGDLRGLETKRPILVWVISIWYGAAGILAILGRFAMVTHLVVPPGRMGEQLQFMTWLDYAILNSMALVRVWAAISLFRLRAIAAPLLGLLSAAGILNTFRYALTKTWLARSGTPTLIATAVGLLISIGVALYASRLRYRGILRSSS